MKKIKQKKLGIRKYLSNSKWGIFEYLLGYIVASVCSIFMTILFANAIEQITNKFYEKAIYIFLIVLGLEVVRRGCWYWTNRVYNKYSMKIMSELNFDLANQAFKLNSKTFNDHDTGTFVQRIVSEPERVVSTLSNIVDIVSDFITSLVMIIYIATLNYYIALILFGIVLIGGTLEYFRIKIRRKNKKQFFKEGEKINSLTTEIVKSEKDIKALGLEEKLSETLQKNYGRYKKANFKFNQTDANFWSIRSLLIEIMTPLILIFGIVLMDKGMLTLASFMIVYSNNGNLYSVLWGLGSIINSITDIKISMERMFSLFDEDEFVTEKFGVLTLENIAGGGEIEFKDVTFTYKEYEVKEPDQNEKKSKKRKKKKEKVLASENKIFDKISFSIQPNTTIAFVGKSGSGKSTILNLMSKMYEVEEGEVLINNVNINDLSKETLRKTISLVNQFPYIFDMTIKENLLLANKNATDDDILRVLKDACLEEFVSELPKGIDTKVGENGIKLSGGQKQRLAIARALLRDSNIIIFDESTSSLDNYAQNHVKKSIDNLKGVTTVVIVAHRLSTIKDVDKIYFLDEGKIIDEGTFDELFEKNDKFKTMFLAENI